MSRNNVQISIACAVGAIVFGLVALWATPAYFWLGFMAGVPAGYIAYEFREVLRAVPLAFKAMREEVSNTSSEAIQGVCKWIAAPHPFLYASIAILIAAMSKTLKAYPELRLAIEWNPARWNLALTFVFVVVVGTVLGVFCLFISTVLMILVNEAQPEQDWRRPSDMGYLEAYRNIGLGLIKLVNCLVFWMWVELAWKIEWLFRVGYTFLWKFVKIIHTQDRLICAVDGPIGGWLTYMWLAPGADTVVAKTVMLLCGAFIGIGIGLFNKHVVAERWLGIAPNANNQLQET